MASNTVYWDANAFLGLINEEADKQAIAQDVWDAMETGHITIVTSALTLAEVIYAKSAGKVDPSKRQLVNDFFRRPNLVIEPLTRRMGELARDVVWDNGIRPKDACHIATAVFHNIDTLHTFDEPMLAKGKVTINGVTVKIIKPKAPRQLNLLPPPTAIEAKKNDKPKRKIKVAIQPQAGKRLSKVSDGSSTTQNALVAKVVAPSDNEKRAPIKAKASKRSVKKKAE